MAKIFSSTHERKNEILVMIKHVIKSQGFSVGCCVTFFFLRGETCYNANELYKYFGRIDSPFEKNLTGQTTLT